MKDATKPSAGCLLLCVSIAAICGLTGCSRNHPPPLTQFAGSAGATATGIPPLTEQKLDPLTSSDVDLYLRVMRAAAARVQHPSTEDTRTLAQAKQIMTAAASGRVPDSADASTLQHASQICMAMDQIVARELRVDLAGYTAVADAIEAVVPNPAVSMPQQKPGEIPVRSPLERRMAEINAANETFLAPYSAEIQGLLAVVRNPANLPKN
ncbi:MAG: hypothetical protein ACLP1Y_03645 [Candidatus Acidiferrales bacterium]